jgi:hypothetical protein
VSPSFLDQYIMAARAMAKQAVGTPATDNRRERPCAVWTRACSLPPGARAGVTGTFLAPFEGDYEIRTRAIRALFTVDGRMGGPARPEHLTRAITRRHGDSLAAAWSRARAALFGFAPVRPETGMRAQGT